mgnify:CR=1 FL=1
MEEKLDKFLAYLEENGVEISGETAFKCDDGIVLFSPNEGGGVDIAIIRNVIIANIIIILRLFFNGLIYHNNCKKGLRFLKDFYLCSNNMHRL